MKVCYQNRTIILPDFLIIGAAKAGTSSLNYWLEDYDEIFMPEPKEPNFFSYENFEDDYEKKSELNRAVNLRNYDFEEYQQLFKGNEEKLIGDASTGYIQYPDNVISNIQRYYGESGKDLKAICLLRNPVAKIYSHYLMFVKWGVETRSFQEAVIPDQKRANTILEQQIDYVDAGYYYDDLNKYMEFFGSNLKVYLFDDLVDDKIAFISDVLEHIGINERRLPGNIDTIFNEGGIPKNELAEKLISLRKNKGLVKQLLKTVLPGGLKEQLKKSLDRKIDSKLRYKPKMDEESKQYLESLFHDDIQKTSSLINRDLTSWLG